jgi:hypothetical protein
MTTDHWNATSLVQRMYSAGIPTKEVPFSGPQQLNMYTLARQKFNAGLVELPEDIEKAVRELINIQLKHGRKIDHPIKNLDDTPGSKDQADAIISVVAQCAYEDRFFTPLQGRYKPVVQTLGKTHVADIMRDTQARRRLNRIKDDIY